MGIRDEDLAATLVELERRLPRAELASVLGVEEDELDEIASGYLPDDGVAARLRALAASDDAPAAGATPRLSRRLIVAFIAADLVFFAVVAVLVLR